MPSSKDDGVRSPAHLPCARIHPDDGLGAPEREPHRPDLRSDRKTLQLCAQIQRALHTIVPAAVDPTAPGFIVHSVDPDPDASRLEVTVCVASTCPYSPTALLAMLRSQRGLIRLALAESINRRRVPQLTFTLIPEGTDQ